MSDDESCFSPDSDADAKVSMTKLLEQHQTDRMRDKNQVKETEHFAYRNPSYQSDQFGDSEVNGDSSRFDGHHELALEDESFSSNNSHFLYGMVSARKSQVMIRRLNKRYSNKMKKTNSLNQESNTTFATATNWSKFVNVLESSETVK